MTPRTELAALVKALRKGDEIECVQITERIAQLAQAECDHALLRARARGRTQQEIASALGITQGAVSQRVKNAQKRRDAR